jgi:glycosyltransferase involved in cell wall biosynthesis
MSTVTPLRRNDESEDEATSVADSSQLTVLIPAFNEEEGIGKTLELLTAEPALENASIIVIDDGSSDRTGEVAAEYPRVRVLRHKNNQGYGAGIKTGTRFATTEWVAWFDADGQHRVEDLVTMFEKAASDGYDAVIGERQQGSNVVATRVPGKAVLRMAARFVVKEKISDINCGLRVFRRDLLAAYLPLLPDGFSASTTSLLVFIKRNRHWVFHPITTEQRVGTSSVRQVRDGFRTLHLMLRILVLFSAFKFFSLVSAICFTVGAAYGISWAIYTGKGIPVLAALVMIVGVLVFTMGIVSDQISDLRLDLLERGKAGDRSHRVR